MSINFRQCNEVDARRKRQPELTSLDSYYRQLSVIKSDVWQSENEWRLMWRSTTETVGVYKIPITPGCIRAVYLGLSIPHGDKQRVVAAVGRYFPHAEVWCATKRHGDLSLDFHRLSEVAK